MSINPDGFTLNKGSKSRRKAQTRVNDTLDFMRKLLEPAFGTNVGGGFKGAGSSSRIPKAPSRSSGGYAAGWRPGAPAKKSTPKSQGGYASGYRPGVYQPGASGQSGSVGNAPGVGGVGAFGGGMDYDTMWNNVMNDILSSGAVDIPDAAEMAQKQFDPQFDLLNQIRTQTTGRMNKQAQDAQAMYDALGQQFDADKSEVTTQYDQAAQSLDAAFSGAGNAVQETGQQSGAELRAMMNKLGITDAGPAAIASIDEGQARSQNTIAEMQANYAGANEASENSMLDYLTAESNTMGVAGANARADVENMLLEALGGLDNQELGLRGQQSAAENEYAMQIANMQQSAQEAQLQAAQNQFNAMMEQQRWGQEFGLDRERFEWGQQTDQWDNEIARAAQERALQEFQSKQSQDSGSGSGSNTKDASTLIVQEAGKHYTPEKANRVAQMIRNALAMPMRNGRQPSTVAELVAAINQRHPGNPDAAMYAHLASMYGQALGLK